MPGRDVFLELGKTLLKVAAIAYVAWRVIEPDLPRLVLLTRMAELAAAREALVDVLQALEPNRDTASAVDEVRDTLQCLEQLHRDRERLQAEMRRIDGQIEATQRLLEASLIAAESQERRQLDSQRLRATLVGEMAQAIVGRTKDGAA